MFLRIISVWFAGMLVGICLVRLFPQRFLRLWAIICLMWLACFSLSFVVE